MLSRFAAAACGLTVVLFAVGCRAHAPIGSTALGAQIAESRRAIAAARPRVDSALATGNRAAAAALLADQVRIVAPPGGRSDSVSRDTMLARFDALTARDGSGAMLLLRRSGDGCAHAGYEYGTFTRYYDDAPGSRTSTSGGYALGWQVIDGVARIATVVVDTTRELRRVPREVVCTNDDLARLLAERAHRVQVGVGPVYTAWSAMRGYGNHLKTAGWTSAAGNDLRCGDGSPGNDRQLELQASARVRISGALSAEIVTSPTTLSRCYQLTNDAQRTRVKRSLELSDHAALLNVARGRLRVGAGVAYAGVRAVAIEDSLNADLIRAEKRVNKSVVGVAGQAVYTFGFLGPHLFGQIAGRARMMPDITMDRLLHYAPGPISTSGVALSISTGVGF